MRAYICGPITGKPDLNRPAFYGAAKLLASLGHVPVNPFDVCGEQTDWHACMKADIKALVDCDGILLLPGYKFSKGATLELTIATGLGIHVFELQGDAMVPIGGPHKRKGSDAKSKRVPASFRVTQEMAEWALSEAPGVDVTHQTAMFMDHEFAVARTDWTAAWRNWMRRATPAHAPRQSFRQMEDSARQLQYGALTGGLIGKRQPDNLFDMEEPHGLARATQKRLG